ncbi:toprim domain-containing protein [Siccationidurans ginsengisoli]|nr:MULTISPECIES: toprim domain-containing protein [unclassified Hymenobacter]MBO2033457.1 toprim domain-containing protein [Hymenobacter sp. BT559]
MNAPTRENDPTELDRFKRDIDLVDYAERQGYQVKKEGKRGDWHQLVKDGEVLIVTRKDDHQVYLNTGDDRDKGSVIDFAKTRGGDGHGLNLGQVRQQLREYLNDGPAPTRSYAPPVEQSRLNALPVGDPDHERQQQEDRKTRLIAEVLGVNKELTDRTYLHGRGITDSTIESPAFQGRIFTAQQNEHKNTAFPLYNEQGLASIEQKNEHYKNLLPLPKNGIWVSHPTQGKDTPVERVVVSESAIDSLSHFQLKHGQDPKNTLYIATSGTPTEAQVALIQRVIDKQEPKEIVLANDRDAGGRQFNMNYMNELHPARPLIPVADQEAYKEASRPVEWHATSDKYHTALKVSYRHDSTEAGTAQVQQLTDRVAKMNGTGEAGPTIELEVMRSTGRETVLRLSVAKADTAQLEVISQELYRQREQLRPEQERRQEAFIRVDYPQAKDWNRDLELTAQGLNAEQIRAQAVLDEQQRAAEREQHRQQYQQRQAEYARSAAMERDEQETRRLYDEAQKQRARDNTLEAKQERQEDDKHFNQAVMGAAGADADSPNDGRPFRSYRSEQEAAEHTAQFVHAKDAGLVLLKEYINDNPPPTGRKVDEAELEELRGRARYAEPATTISLPTSPSSEEKTATWKIDEVAANTTGRAEAWKEVLDNSGYSMRTSEVRSTVDEQGIRRAEFDLRYQNDQPDIAIIHAIVTNTNARAEAGNEMYAGVSVAESEPDRAARQAAAEAAAIQPHNRDRSQDVAGMPVEVQVSSTPAAGAAEAQQSEPSFTAARIYVNVMPNSEGQINSRDTSPQPASYSLYQIQVDAQNPHRAVLLPAPGADPQLLNGYHAVLRPAYELSGAPKPGDAYVAVSSPTQLERTEQGWRITQRGQASFSPTPTPERSLSQERSTAPNPAEKEAASVGAQGSEKQVIIKVDEPAIRAGERGQAEAVQAAITSSGAKAGDIQSTTDAKGIRHSEMKVSYRTDQPELARISQTLDAVANQKGSQVIEHSSDRAERKDISRGQELSLKRTRTAEITR